MGMTDHEARAREMAEEDYPRPAHPDHCVCSTCHHVNVCRGAFVRGYRALRTERDAAREEMAVRMAEGQRPDRVGCTLAGPGRGDCAHAVGLPGRSIPGQHDGPDDTVDVYGKPNGWCWSCWKDHRIARLEAGAAHSQEETEGIMQRFTRQGRRDPILQRIRSVHCAVAPVVLLIGVFLMPFFPIHGLLTLILGVLLVVAYDAEDLRDALVEDEEEGP